MSKIKKILNISLIITYIAMCVLIIDRIKIIISPKELMIFLLLVIAVGVIFCFMFRNNILNIIADTLIIVIAVFLLNVNTTSKSVFNFIDGIVTEFNVIDNYRIIVLKDKYDSISELENKNVGYTRDTLGINNVEITFNNVCYESYDEMILALADGTIEAALVLEEQYKEMDDKDLYEIIYELNFEEKVESTAKDFINNTVLIYVSGMDSYESLSKTGRSDVNMIIGINSKTNQILLISIPRDYYVELADSKAYDKLTHAGIYGINSSIKTVENLLEVEIDYYLKVNFTSLEAIIDKLGGIEVESDTTFVSGGIEFTEGINALNGYEALVFSRERKGLLGGDRTRGENQQKVIEGIVKKLSSKKSINEYSDILDSLKDSVKTNIPESEIYKIVKNQIVKSPKWKFIKYSLNGDDAYEYTYSYKCCKLYVMKPYRQTIDEAITLIEYLKTDGIFN